jgi:hypothetical protein
MVRFGTNRIGTYYTPLLKGTMILSGIEQKAFTMVGGRWVSEMEDSKFSFQVSSNLVRISPFLIMFRKILTERSLRSVLVRSHVSGYSRSLPRFQTSN